MKLSKAKWHNNVAPICINVKLGSREKLCRRISYMLISVNDKKNIREEHVYIY